MKNRGIGQLSEAEIKRTAKRSYSKKRKARIGFIGAGWWATTNHIPILHARKDVELVSVCGLDPKVLESCQRDFGFSHATTDYKELLKQDIDGVVIASPHVCHAEHALAALKANCHIMVEKPFTTDAKSARQVVALAKKKKRHLVVPYGWHYRPLSLEARRLMSKNPLGKIEFVLCHMASPAMNLFTGKSFDFSDGAYVDANLSTWADPILSKGGYGQGQLSHAIGLMLWLTGLRAESVYANLSNVRAKVDMYDALSVRYEGGAIGSISGAATLPVNTPGTFQLDIRIFGEHGLLHVDIARDHLSLHTHKGRHEYAPLRTGDGSYQCDEPPHQFVELILGLTKSNNSPGEVALGAVEILDAAYRSNESGKNESV
ncbi:MAG: Gfo/Idh/MocA family oxidoreductase [Chthoniobacterales bacterium]